MSDEIDNVAGQGEGEDDFFSLFGIDQETKSSNNVPIPPPHQGEHSAMYPNSWIFPICRLVNVVTNPQFEKKNGDKVPILMFTFRTAEGQTHIHFEWLVDKTDKDAKVKILGLNSRIKHIWENTIGVFPSEPIGRGMKTFTGYFKAIADKFNGAIRTVEGKEVKIYTTNRAFIKLIYTDKNELKFPLSPNFLELVDQKEPRCKVLVINPKYDRVVPKSKVVTPGMSGGNSLPPMDALPTFNEDFD